MSAYTKVRFPATQPDSPTANKLNLLIDDLSAAIASAGGGGTSTGDMLKSVYDTDNNGKVDTADSIPWTSVTGKPSSFTPGTHAGTHLSAGSDPIALATSVLAGLCPAVDNTTIQVVTSKLSCVALAWTAITGKPATFPPDSTAMLKSVYDTNANNKVDSAETADSVPWTGITGRPSTFTPAPHAPTHLDNGTDVIPVVTTSRTGLVPTLNGNAATYLNGSGAYATVAYGSLTGIPGSFNPSAHAATHKSGGSDVIALDTLGATTDITTLNSSTTAHGLCPKLSGTTTTFLRGDGTWQAPAGAGDMTKAVYDVNGDNIVDKAAALSTAGSANQFWKNGNVWGQPAWTDLSGVPSAFTPSTHASAHASGGSDPLPANAISTAMIADGQITGAKIAGSTITNTNLASGVAVANLGYTPLNKAGDAFGGDFYNTAHRFVTYSNTGLNSSSWSAANIEISNSGQGAGARPGIGFECAGVTAAYLYYDTDNKFRFIDNGGTVHVITSS